MHRARIVVQWLLLAALAGCAPQQPGAGERATASARPTIMSMNPCLDAILLRVAEPGQIVSVSHYSHDPGTTSVDVRIARRFPANYDTAEEAVAARPNIVLTGPHISAATQNAIAAAGVRIVSLDVPATLADSVAQVREVARAAGHPGRGERLAAEIDAALARARPPAGALPFPAVVRMGAGGLVPGVGTLPDELLAATGFRNMSADYGLAQWDVLPIETLALRPPRVILTDLADPHRARVLPIGVGGVRAMHFPSRLLQCAGPNLIEAAGRLATIRRQVQRGGGA